MTEQQQIKDMDWYLTKGLNALSTAHKYRHTSIMLQEIGNNSVLKVQAFALDEANSEHAAHWSRVIKNKARLHQITQMLSTNLWFITLVGFKPCNTLKQAIKKALETAKLVKTKLTGIICPEVRIVKGVDDRYEPHLHMIMQIPDESKKQEFRKHLKTLVETNIKNPLRMSYVVAADHAKVSNYMSKHCQTHAKGSNKRQPLSNTSFLAETAVMYEIGLQSHQLLIPTGDLFWCKSNKSFKLGRLCRTKALTNVQKMKAKDKANIPNAYATTEAKSGIKNTKNSLAGIYTFSPKQSNALEVKAYLKSIKPPDTNASYFADV